jgi:hypothetical protein
MSETTHPKAGAAIMTTFAHSTETTGNAKRVTIFSAVFGMIAVFSVAQSSGTQAPAVAMATAHQSELQGLLCRIDRRCPANELTTREASSRADAPATAVEVTHPSDLSGLLCRIDRRCPATGLATREASQMQTAENTAR